MKYFNFNKTFTDVKSSFMSDHFLEQFFMSFYVVITCEISDFRMVYSFRMVEL